MSTTFLDTFSCKLHLLMRMPGFWCFCSFLGVIIIVLGFYSFMWGKAKEDKISHMSKFDDFSSPTPTVPLLGNNGEETENSAA